MPISNNVAGPNGAFICDCRREYLAPTEDLIKTRRKALFLAIRGMREAGAYIDLEIMIENTRDRTAYSGRDQYGRLVEIGLSDVRGLELIISEEGSVPIPQGQDLDSVTARFALIIQRALLLR